jgi:hypothetical protein
VRDSIRAEEERLLERLPPQDRTAFPRSLKTLFQVR